MPEEKGGTGSPIVIGSVQVGMPLTGDFRFRCAKGRESALGIARLAASRGSTQWAAAPTALSLIVENIDSWVRSPDPSIQ
jgi:hypothetical protein